MNPLAILLGQQAGVEAAGPVGNEILVTRNRTEPSVTPDYSELYLNNTEAVRNVQADIAKTEEESQRKGMFGTRGTLRNILGVLGDAFLVQSGNKPVYGPHRQKERISDAMAGFTQDPMAAGERVAYYDPEMGYKLVEDAKNAELRQAQLDSLTSSRQSLMDDRAFKQYKTAREQIGALFNTPGAVINGQINPQALQIAEKIAASANMTLEEFLINDQMTEKEVRDYAMSVLNPYQQERLEDYDAGRVIDQQNADSRRTSANASMIRAQRPPAGRAPQQPTTASMLDEFMRIPANQRTLEQQDFIDRNTLPSRSQRRSSGQRRTTTQSRFRPARN